MEGNVYLSGMYLVQLFLHRLRRHIGNDICPGVGCACRERISWLQILRHGIDEYTEAEGDAYSLGAGERKVCKTGSSGYSGRRY